MKAFYSPSPRIRNILDAGLILLLLLAISAHGQGAARQPAAQRLPSQALAPESAAATHLAAPLPRLAGENIVAPQTPADDNTLAAMIAAENAALTLPQYWIVLPLITR